MFNVRDIIRNNDATFYDFNTRKKQSQILRLALTAAVSFSAAIFFPKVSDNLLAGFLAVQSILLGFTVNVMFFLLGNRERKATKHASIEAELRSDRLRKLYRELFYNVSYFNMIAVASIIMATALLLPTPEIPAFSAKWPGVEAYSGWLATSQVPSWISRLSRGVAIFIFFALAIEVIFSIARIIGRTSFYFEQKMSAAD